MEMAVGLVSIARDFLPPTRFKKSERNAPHYCFYLTTKNQKRP